MKKEKKENIFTGLRKIKRSTNAIENKKERKKKRNEKERQKKEERRESRKKKKKKERNGMYISSRWKTHPRKPICMDQYYLFILFIILPAAY